MSSETFFGWGDNIEEERKPDLNIFIIFTGVIIKDWKKLVFKKMVIN